MADEKLYEFGSDEELERYLEGLSDEDRDTFLREYATKDSEAYDEDLKKAALEDEEASPAEIERYESTISEIEAGNTNKFNTNPQSSRQALEKTLNRSLRSSSSDRRWHTMRLAVINNGAGFYNAYNGGAATIKFTVPVETVTDQKNPTEILIMDSAAGCNSPLLVKTRHIIGKDELIL